MTKEKITEPAGTDVAALMNAIGPAYDDVQSKGAARDEAARSCDAKKQAAKKAFEAATDAAQASLDKATADLSSSQQRLTEIQAKLSAVIGKVLPQGDGRLR